MSEPNAYFVVAIANSTQSATDSLTVSSNPLPVAPDSLIVLTRTYYDDYNFAPGVRYNDAYDPKLDTGAPAGCARFGK